jgi:hypothetical protein
MTVRIKGLVSAFNDVRAQLQAGISPAQEQRFRNHVQALVKRVEGICKSHGTTTGSLPSPTRRAYTFLKALNTRDLPPPRVVDTANPVPRISVANVVKDASQFSKRMWDGLPDLIDSDGGRSALATEIRDAVSRIEAACSQLGATPNSLKSPSRRAYCWLKFIQDEDNLRLHITALNCGMSAIQCLKPKPNNFELHLENMSSIWRRRTRGKLILVKVNEGFIGADSEVWQGIIDNAMNGRKGKVNTIVDGYVDSDEFSGVLFEVGAFAENLITSSGLAHDLDDSFDRVNTAYFDGKLPKPRLHWNQVLTTRKFGHYEFAGDRVMVSISLDDPTVSTQVVDYVMFHELLHKFHGVKLINGRRLVHTPAFKNDEQSFDGYEDATAQLTALARRHGSR